MGPIENATGSILGNGKAGFSEAGAATM
jgi:hypothetical protein